MAGGERRPRVEIVAGHAGLDRGLRGAHGKLRAWAGSIKRDIGRSLRGAFDTLSGVAGFGGIAGLGLAAKQVIDFETRLTRLGLAGRASAQRVGLLRDQIFDVAAATGVSSTELLGAMERFVAMTGDIDGAAAAMRGLGMVATATGANVEEVTVSAAALRTNMGVTGAEMERAFSVLLTQGKSGAIELKDMAQIVEGLTPQFATFGKRGVEGVAQMSALLQVMRQGFGSASETATGMASLMTAIVKNNKRLAGVGVKVFESGPDGKKRLRDLADITFELIEKSKGNPAVLQKILGRQEAYQAILPLISQGRGEVSKLIDEGLRSQELASDFAKMADTPAMKMAKAKAQIDRTFNQLLARNLDTIAKAFQGIADVLQWMLTHKAEVLAIFGAFKGASFLGGMAGSMGGAGAMSNLAGAAGGAGGATSRAGRFAGHASNAMAGLGVGLVVAETLGRDLPMMSKGVLASAHALAMLPGPLGLVGKASAVAADGLLLLFNHLESRIDAEQSKIVRSTFGAHSADLVKRATRSPEEMGQSQRALLRRAGEAGALSPTGEIDFAKLDAALKKEGKERTPWGEVGEGLGQVEQALIKSFVANSQLTEEGRGFARKEAARQLVEKTTQQILVKISPAPGLHAEVGNDPNVRRSPR